VKIPRTLGRYEVVDLIGRGGMGALYRARDPRIGRYVAIKQLRPEFDTPELRDRFSREAAAAGSLSHPNIVTIFDVGEDDGLPFIAMEYVRGETFTDVLGLRPPLSVQRKLQLMEEVCAGLAHAHEAGIVHRDIKPANLILGSEGIVKILDFGIAKLSASGITLPGVILGTMNYMAPEQIRGEAVDARADVFAVGAVLYELLTHRQAFPGRAANEVLDRILNGVPKPITESCPDIDPRLVDLVHFALEKDADQRIQEIAALQKELANIRLKPSVGESQRATRRGGSSQGQTGLITPPPSPVSGSRPPAPTDRDHAQRAQIDEHLIAAEREFEAGNYDAAIESCKQVLMLDDSDDRAIAQLDRIHAAFDEQQALAEIAAREQEDEGRVRSGVEDARRRFARGDHQAALKSLEALDPNSHALVSETLEELQASLREIEDERRASRERAERRQRLVDTLATARAAIQNDDLVESARLLEALRDIDSDAPEVSDFAERLRRAHAATRLKAEVDVILRDFDEALERDDLPRAGDLLNSAAMRAPHDSRVDATRKRLDDALAARVAKEAAEARAREAEQRLEEAIASFENDDLAGAAEKLNLATALAPHDPRAGELAVRLGEAIERRAAAEAAERLAQDIAALIADASRRFHAAGEVTSELQFALRDVNRALALGPGSADALSLKTAIEAAIAAHREVARVKAVVNNARTRFANGKRQAAIHLLEEFQPATHPDIQAALSELRAALQKIDDEQRAEQERIKKLERLAELFTQAQGAIGEHRFDAALELLTLAAEIDPAAAELANLRQRVDQEQAAVRVAAELEARLLEFNEHLSAGDLPGARELLEAAAALTPADQAVHAARRRLDQAVAAREAAEAHARDLEAKQADAEALFAQGDLDGALRLIKLAQSLGADQPHTALLCERIEQAITQREEAAAADRRRQAAEDLLAAASKRLQSTEHQAGDLALAVQEIDQVLALEPEHAGALALKATAQAAVAGQQQAAVIRASIRNARNRFANGKHQTAIQLLEKLDPAANPLVEETLKELRAALHEIEEKRRVEQERVEKQRQVATLIGTARAAIKAARFSEALEALSAARSIDASADGLAELSEQAQRGQSGELTATPPDEAEMAADEDATRFIMLDPNAGPRRVNEAGQPRPTPASGVRAAEDRTQSGTPNLQGADGPATSRTWLWVVAAAAAVLLLLVLVALYLRSRPARIGTYPVEMVPPGAIRRVADAEGLASPHGAAERMDRGRAHRHVRSGRV
jgi:serine/threonine protein kinase